MRAIPKACLAPFWDGQIFGSSATEMNREATGLAGVRPVTYETLGSTNAEALALARAGERGPLWITAPEQSAGRGRRGNAWVSSPAISTPRCC